MKLFISQPMAGKSDEEIRKARETAIAEVKEMFEEKVNVIDSFIKKDPPNDAVVPLWYLGMSILLMSKADVVYFAKGWRESSSCVIESTIANAYNLCCIQTD